MCPDKEPREERIVATTSATGLTSTSSVSRRGVCPVTFAAARDLRPAAMDVIAQSLGPIACCVTLRSTSLLDIPRDNWRRVLHPEAGFRMLIDYSLVCGVLQNTISASKAHIRRTVGIAHDQTKAIPQRTSSKLSPLTSLTGPLSTHGRPKPLPPPPKRHFRPPQSVIRPHSGRH